MKKTSIIPQKHFVTKNQMYFFGFGWAFEFSILLRLRFMFKTINFSKEIHSCSYVRIITYIVVDVFMFCFDLKVVLYILHNFYQIDDMGRALFAIEMEKGNQLI